MRVPYPQQGMGLIFFLKLKRPKHRHFVDLSQHIGNFNGCALFGMHKPAIDKPGFVNRVIVHTFEVQQGRCLRILDTQGIGLPENWIETDATTRY